MNSLEGVFSNEYNNLAGLQGGFENGITDEFLGEIKRLTPYERTMAMAKVFTPIASKGSRLEMEKHWSEVPLAIRQQVDSGSLRLADTMLFSIKPVTSKTIKCYETSDTKKTGLRSFSEGRLPKNSALIVSGITLLAAVAPSANEDEVAAANFQSLELFPVLANGEFSLKANKKVIVPEGSSNRIFCTNNFKNVPAGYYKLSNPRVIEDAVSIELTIELGSLSGIAANTYIFAALHGTITTP